MTSFRFQIIVLALLALIQGCAPSLRRAYLDSVARPEQARSFFLELDRTIKKNNAQNVVYASVPGFPYLRADRFLFAVKDRLHSSAMQQDWVAYLKTRQLEARRSEVSGLQSQEIERLFSVLNLPGPASRDRLMDYVREYSDLLHRHDLNHPNYIETLVESVEVPDDYSTLMRTLGLYPLAYLPVAYFSDRVFDKFRAWHQLPLEHFENEGDLITYSAALHPQEPLEIPEWMRTSPVNTFGLPTLTASDRQRLAHAFAPVIHQDTSGSYDRIGTFEWRESFPVLNLETPTVYYYITYGLLMDKPIVQINYSFWYRAREGEKAPWYERGEFDGITVRVSLDEAGIPFMVDIMNNCGCYHFFVPGANRIQSVKELDFALDPLVPRWLPAAYPALPLLLRVNSGWHQVEHIAATSAIDPTIHYRLTPYEALESLTAKHGRTVNLFDNQGIMKGSYRIEPYIFFSMGIPKVGFMRQRGHHPIKMIGREHFDNPHLFNRNFTFK